MLLFSYQCPRRIVSFLRTILFVVCHFLIDSLLIISHLFFFVKNFFKFFQIIFCDICSFFTRTTHIISIQFVLVKNFFHHVWWKSGEGGVRTLAPLLTTYSLSRRAPSASWVLLQTMHNSHSCCLNGKRRRWDSNPRSLSESLVFKTSSLNHSDTSPNVCSNIL